MSSPPPHYRAALLLWALVSASVATAPAADALRTVSEVRALSPAQVEAGQPVHLRGVVTYHRGGGFPNFVLQDGTGGLMVGPPKDFTGDTISPGMEVEVEGITSTHKPSPLIVASMVKTANWQGLPAPQQASVDELLAGKHEGFWVEVSGVIRGIRVEREIPPQRLVLDFGPRDRRLTAWVSRFEGSEGALQPGATVRLRGVCLHWKNQRWEPVSTFLVVNSPDDVTLIAAPTEPPLLSVAELAARDPLAATDREVRVRGIVTLHRPGELLVLQDGESGVRVHPSAAEGIVPGDAVEISGFPGMGVYTTELDATKIQRTGAASSPVTPEPLPIQTLFNADADGRLVRVTGEVTEVRRRSDLTELALRSGTMSFSVTFATGVDLPRGVGPGAQVAVTGVCVLRLSERARFLGNRPDLASILARGSDDLELLRAEPWWNAERLRLVLGIAGGAVLAAIAWALLLRRQVRRRTEQLAGEIRARHTSEVKFEAVLGERRRLARELHDSLAQGLTAAALQIQAAEEDLQEATAPQPAALTLARQLLDHSRDELRRSVWELNSAALDAGDLTSALDALARTASVGDFQVETTSVGNPERLPRMHAHHLLRIAQEAIANARAHGHATRVTVGADFGPEQIVLTIRDNGVGFTPSNAPGAAQGHFGLQSMRERLRHLGGTLRIDSAPGTGTTIVATVPRPAEEPAES